MDQNQDYVGKEVLVKFYEENGGESKMFLGLVLASRPATRAELFGLMEKYGLHREGAIARATIYSVVFADGETQVLIYRQSLFTPPHVWCFTTYSYLSLPPLLSRSSLIRAICDHKQELDEIQVKNGIDAAAPQAQLPQVACDAPFEISANNTDLGLHISIKQGENISIKFGGKKQDDGTNRGVGEQSEDEEDEVYFLVLSAPSLHTDSRRYCIAG